ncbi:DUF2809 domain-containing protein [Armatimonas sp.]|uniref:ribosomal maturation YjgA family protein n=1 Tax=Armatimonas sp. TaxID=1872638 RepID=UPI00375204BE
MQEFVSSRRRWLFLALACIPTGLATRPLKRQVEALAIACLVEFSQLWHTPWLEALRQTKLGALAVGGSFSWGDLGCYGAGIALGALLDKKRK